MADASDQSAGKCYAEKENGGYTIYAPNGKYISGPHPSKEYADKKVARLNGEED